MFNDWKVNRTEFPEEWILICEDDAEWQSKFIEHLAGRYGCQGKVFWAVAPSASFAFHMVANMDMLPKAILLDHDMPWGNGIELLVCLREHPEHIPVCATSGIPGNNEAMMKCGADHTAQKGDWNSLDLWLDGLEK